MTRSAADIRHDFLEFFRRHGHTVVPGSPVVPYDDPTLLFTNAGMNQFKDVFLGAGTRAYRRAADSQPCIRAGGKHNDLDDVGQDTYHHTFFEMLGNWSFGDYFKKEAIAWAWELLTDVWGLEKDRLHAAYFEGDESEGLEPDLEARELWATVTDIDPTHVHPGGKKDNFWEMGATGPCGPCSEIHMDLTPDKSGSKLVNAGDPRVIEIWNLVFIQFNRDASGRLTPLPARHVDTGMGFERVCALLQGKSSNYDTDVFTPIFEAIRDITGAPPYRGTLPGQSPDREQGVVAAGPRTGRGVGDAAADRDQLMIDVSYRVIADHARCLTFALNDGAVPDREGRGYVLRRILRRAVRYGWQYMNMHEPFLYKLVPVVVDTLGDAFPQLKGRAAQGSGRRPVGRDELTRSPAVGPQRVAEIIHEEEESFDRTLDRGIALFEEAAEYARKRHHGEIRGEDAFRLHDTYGFPIDLTQIMAEEKGLTVDIAEYERLMEEARERARTPSRVDVPFDLNVAGDLPPTDDSFKYAERRHEGRVLGFVYEGIVLTKGAMEVGDQGTVGLILDETCAYAEQGGQAGDGGYVRTETGEFFVETTKAAQDCILHVGSVSQGKVEVGQRATIELSPLRTPTMQNHTATHVMNWALRAVLGEHVQQKGSLVDPDKTRFDFSHSKAMTPAEIERVEQLVNDKIRQNLTVYDEPVPQEQALKIHGLRAVFGEKYPDVVRVMSIGVPVKELLAEADSPRWRDVSIEFCGGTHCRNTGQIEHFAITTEEAVAKGIRRVVGITGTKARQAIDRGAELLQQAEELKKGAPSFAQQRVGDGSSVAARAPRGRASTADTAVPPEDVAAGISPAEGADLASLVAELQQAVTESEIRVVDRNRLRDALAELQQILKKQHKQQAAAARDVVAEKVAELLADAPTIGETTVIVAEMPDLPADQLKTGADMIKQKCKSAAVLFGVWADRPSEPGTPATGHGKALLLAAMSNDLVKRGIKAGDLVKQLAPLVKGGGGGPPTMAQAGGKDPGRLADALEAGRKWIEERLA